MSKQPTITDLSTLADVISPINDNFDNIQSSFDNTLSRDGSGPNQMEADIDLNSNDLLNVRNVNADNLVVDGVNLNTKVAEAATSAANAATSETNAATSETNAAASAVEAAQYDPTTKYANVTAFFDSEETYLDNTYVTTTEEGFVYKAVSSGADVTNDGGQGFEVQKDSAGYKNIIAFGAIGDGITDDDSAVQAANSAGGAILFPAGTYLADTVAMQDQAKFVGKDGAKLKLKDSSLAATGNFVYAHSRSHVEIHNLIIDANVDNQGGEVFGLRFTDCADSSITGCTIFNASYGITSTTFIRNRVEGNTIYDCRFVGILATQGGQALVATGLTLKNNTIYNVASSAGTGADGKGIFVTGQTGATEPEYGYVSNIDILGNDCKNCAVNGIQLTALENFTVNGNICTENSQNTTLSAGITISEAARYGAITGNVCNDNGVAGIQLDVVTQYNESFGFGLLSITGNVCSRNNSSGIRVQSMPNTIISGNHLSENLWGILIDRGSYYTITGNQFYKNSENGVRIAGGAAPVSPDRQNVVVSNNLFHDNADTVTSSSSAIYISNFDRVNIEGNAFFENRVDLNVASSAANVDLLNNSFTSSLSVAGGTINRWPNARMDDVTSFVSSAFGGEGKDTIRVNAGFTVEHFGRDYVQLLSISAVTSDGTTAIADGYSGQRLQIVNFNNQDITIQDDANTRNIGSVDITLSYGDLIEYTFARNGLWVQSKAVVSTGL